MTSTAALPTSSVLGRYEALVRTGALERDGAQVALAKRLDVLATTLGERRLAAKSGALGWLFSRRKGADVPPKGLYIWGHVGRGKTFLMDLFYEEAPVKAKRRAHFHAFMADVHERIHAWRQRFKRGEVTEHDPIQPVAADLAAEASLLCFDEFAVTDIADAMILARLFTALFEKGVVVVATSNVAPERLYADGLNRALFLPFLDLLAARSDVVQLQSRTDFRLEKLGGAPVYHVPADASAARALDVAFHALTGTQSGKPLVLAVKGHDFHVPQVAGGVARASFADVCAQALGASDYIALAQRFHTLVLDDIPLMTAANCNEARRFIILIDALYEHHVKLVASAAAEPHQLYVAEGGYEAFAFDRTVSRLIEMRAQDYLALPHGRADSQGSGATTGLVET
jgi:cell division protein ZapE